MKYSTVFIAFFLLLGAINALPTQHYSERTSTCAKQCLNHEKNLFKEIGSTTSMNYETISEIELQNGQRTQVQLRAKVDIATISKCEHQMQLRKVQIDGPKEAEIMKKQLERHSTKFSQDNSRIESICFDEDEETWVLNLKKAILSTMQVSVHGERQTEQQIVEKDVLGYTQTKYEQLSVDSIKKTKFLSTSSQRSKSVNSMLSGDFGKQKRSTCKIQLDNEKQVLKSVVCEETNSMLPFAQSKASGHVSTITKMSLDKIERTQPQSMNKQLIRDSLTFNKKHYNRHQGQEMREVVQKAEQLIREIETEVEHNVQKETPEKIKKLVQQLAILNVQQLEKLAQQVSNKNDKVQDIFFDTVAQTGTQETAHIILKVILDKKYYKGQVSKIRTAYWLSMLSNVEQVTDEILDIAIEHLKKENLPRQALLALSNMINEIKHDEEIKQDQRYKQVVEALIQKFNRQSDEQEKITILKALRNTGVHHQVFDQVFNIAEKKSHHVETRIASVQALEQHVTEERYHQKLMKIFEDNSNEAELRIAAFQVLVDNQVKVHELYNVLKTESNKQVGSYVVSYFKNARESQLPERETLKRIASTFDLPEKKFEREDFRQSKHMQFTQHFEKLDLGAQIEADMVYDEQKQLRNVRARFDLNRENLQVKSLEITVRQNGLPEFAQQMVHEITRSNNLNAIVDEIKEMTSIRSKYQLNHKINRLVRMLNLNKINLNNRRLTEQVDASIQVRVEDKTVLYLNMKDIQQFASTFEQQLNQREQIVDQIMESLTGDHALTLIWLNKLHKMPTHHGLPVHSGHSWVSVLGLKIENGAFYPSIATDLHYEMGFTIMNVHPAIHHHVQMHSAAGMKVEVERKNGVPTKVAISMPENRLEVFSVGSKVHLQTATEKIELNVEKKQRKGCTNVLDKVLGVELCHQTVYPRNLIEKNAWNVLLNGPMEFSLHFQKTDSSIKHWELNFETPFAQRTGEVRSMHFGFNTVGSRINREVSAKIELQNERDSKIVHIDLKTPVKSAKIEARAQWTQQQVGLKAALIMDNQRFEAEIGGEKISENGEQQYRPSVKLVIPGQRKIHYTGKVAMLNSGKKENFQIELKDSTTNKPLIKASVIKSGRIDASESFKLATDLHAFWFTGSSVRFVSNIQKDDLKGLITDVEIIHSSSRHEPTIYKWKVAMKDLSNNQNSKYNADFEVNVPRTQFENVAISFNYGNKQNQDIETEIIGFWNNHNGQKTRQVHILQQLKMNKKSAKISSLNENLLKIEIVPLSVNYEVQAKTNWQRSQQKYNVQLTARDVQTNKQYKGEMSYQLPETRPLKMNLDARIMIDNNEFKITHKIEEQKSQEYHGRTMVQMRKGEQVEMNYVYKMKEHSLHVPTRLHHELDAEIRVPSQSWTIKHKSGLKLNANQFEIKHSLRSNNAVVSDVEIAFQKNTQSKLWIDNQWFHVNAEGDLSEQTNQKQINLAVQCKKHQISHQTKLQWSGRQQIKVDSKTTKDQKQIAQIWVDYLKNQKAEAKVQVDQLGEVFARHQHNGQQWATVDIKSDYFSRPIRQEVAIEKQSNNKYTIRSKTHQDKQIIGELNLEMGSQSSLKVSAYDWQITGKIADKQLMNLSLENSKENLKEELEIELRNKVARVQFKHRNEQQRESKLVGQVSTVEESKLQFDNDHANVEFSVKPTGRENHIRLTVNDKRHNIQHNSELRRENSFFFVTLEHTENGKVVVKHNTKLSKHDDSYTKTETKKFEIEALYKKDSAFELKFNNKNGLEHFTTIEIIDARNKIARIDSITMKKGEQIIKFKIETDSPRKIDLHVAYQQEKEIKLKINLKDQQKQAHLELRSDHFEINSKWNKESHKDQKYTLDIVDKKHDYTYNVNAHHQRKTLLQIKVDGKRNGQTYEGELKLHKNGQALLRFDGQDLKFKNELDFTRSPAQGHLELECRKHSIKHQTTVTFAKEENELKIESKTNKHSKQLHKINLRINPTTKQFFASGEIQNKNLKIEGNVNRRYSIELNNLQSDEQFKHATKLDLNARTLRSETEQDNKRAYKIDLKITNRRDVDGSVNLREHELVIRSNENAKRLELNYNNQKMAIKSTGVYTLNRRTLSAKINAQQRSKQVIDLQADLQIDNRSFDARLNAFDTRSSMKVEISPRSQIRASVNFENQEQKSYQQIKEVRLVLDTITSLEKKVFAKVHTQDWKIEKEIKSINGQDLKIVGDVEHKGRKLFKTDLNIRSLSKMEGKVHFDTKDFKGQATVERLDNGELKIEFLAKNGEEKKIADIKSKLEASNNKLILFVNFDSHWTAQYNLVSQLKDESNQWVMTSIVKSNGQKVGKLDARIRVEGLTLDAKLEGDLTVDGRRSEIVYKLNNLDNKLEHVFKVQQQNYSYGYDISIHLKQGKWIIHLPNRLVEMKYDVTSQTNGHILINLDFLPNAEHQPNNIYNIKLDNLISMDHQELILNTKTIVHHPEIHHPIEMQFRAEWRELSHQRPLVIFVAYDASSNQQNRISTLFEILNESNNVRVAHFNVSHQNQQIFDIHYRWAMNTQLVHQQLTWSILNQQNQKQTGDLLAQINLGQRLAKIELNNKHKLQLNWEQNFDKNIMIQLKAQTDNLVRKTKIITNKKEQQVEISNYENERIVSNYVVTMLKAKNTLYAIEMHKKQGGKLQKVAFIQLVRDSLNYGKLHMKVEKSLLYEIQKDVDQLKSKARSVAKRHVKEISAIAREQKQKMKLDEQMRNTVRLAEKANEDLVEIVADYTRFLQKYLPNVFQAVHQLYKSTAQHMRQVWNVNLEEKISEWIEEIIEQVKYADRKISQWKETVEYKFNRLGRKMSEWQEEFNHEVIVKLSNQLENTVQDVLRFAEQEGEQVFEFLYRTLRHVKLEKLVERVRNTVISVKDQIKNIRVHENLHRIYNYQANFDGKWELRDGEIKGQFYLPNKWWN